VSIILDNNNFILDLYFKPTHSGRYLHYLPQHSNSHKKGVIFGLVDRMWKLSDPKFHQKNLEYIIQILLHNGYPLTYIFSNINTILKRLLHYSNNNTEDKNTKSENEKKGFLKIPFVENVIQKFVNIAKKHNLNTIFSIDNKLLI